MHSVQRRSGIRGNYTAMSRELAVCVSPRVPALRVTYIAYRHTEPYTQYNVHPTEYVPRYYNMAIVCFVWFCLVMTATKCRSRKRRSTSPR